jgi:hypothetical protein
MFTSGSPTKLHSPAAASNGPTTIGMVDTPGHTGPAEVPRPEWFAAFLADRVIGAMPAHHAAQPPSLRR